MWRYNLVTHTSPKYRSSDFKLFIKIFSAKIGHFDRTSSLITKNEVDVALVYKHVDLLSSRY